MEWYMDRNGPERTGAAVGAHLRLPLKLKWKVKTTLHANREPLSWQGCSVLWSNHEEWVVDIESGKILGKFQLRDLLPEDQGYNPSYVKEPAKGNLVIRAAIDPLEGSAIFFVPAEHRIYAKSLPDLNHMWDRAAPPVWDSVIKQLVVRPPVMLADSILWTAEGPWVGCMDLSHGKERWRITHSNNVFNISADGQRVIVGTEEGVACFEIDSGALIWTAPIGKTVLYIALVGGVGYACPQDEGIVAMDLSDGKVLWKNPIEPYGATTAPCYINDALYVGSSKFMLAISTKNGEILWKTKGKHPHSFRFRFSHPVATEDHIVVGGGAYPYVYIFHRETGELVWTFKTKSEVNSSPVIYKGKVIIGSLDRHYYCFESSEISGGG